MTANGETDPRYGRAIIHGAMYIGAYLAESEKDEKRRGRMRVALREQLEAYHDLYSDTGDVIRPVTTSILRRVPTDWSPDIARTYLIDLLFTRPFAPAELKISSHDRDVALAELTTHLGLQSSDLKSIIDTAKSAEGAHRGWLPVGKAAMVGAGAIVLLAVTASAAVPALIGAAGAASLSGAAAITHGLTLLGFGSLATGGLGMAGGLWVVAGVGAVGGLGGSKAAALVKMGPSAARTELIKLQTTIVEVTLRSGDKAAAAQYVGSLLTERDEVRARRDEALKRNEDDAAVVKEIKDVEDALGDAIRWINDRLEES